MRELKTRSLGKLTNIIDVLEGETSANSTSILDMICVYILSIMDLGVPVYVSTWELLILVDRIEVVGLRNNCIKKRGYRCQWNQLECKWFKPRVGGRLCQDYNVLLTECGSKQAICELEGMEPNIK